MPLAPRRVRLAVYAVLVVIALASIWLIDRRVVVRMTDQQPSRTMPSPVEVQP